MSERQPYSRVYWSIVDDAKFSDVYDDDRKLATWLRLLILHDQSYPASAPIPRGTNGKALQSLVEVGLVDLMIGDRFRIHGLDRERARRRPANAGPPPVPDLPPPGPGPEPEGNRNGYQGLSRAEPSKDETRQAEPSTATPDPASVLWNLTGKYPKEGGLRWVDELTSSYGPEAVIRALATCHRQDPHANTILGRTQDLLRAEARALDLKEQARVRASLKERRATPQPEIDPVALEAEIAKILRGEAA